MACEHLSVDGHTFIVCGLRREKSCACGFCGKPSTKQCDYPIEGGKTCDAYMCDGCSVKVGENLDHCLGHSRVGKRYSVVSGRHSGHTMLLLAWRQVTKWHGARQRVWKYAGQCSCLKAGDLEAAHLALLDLESPIHV